MTPTDALERFMALLKANKGRVTIEIGGGGEFIPFEIIDRLEIHRGRREPLRLWLSAWLEGYDNQEVQPAKVRLLAVEEIQIVDETLAIVKGHSAAGTPVTWTIDAFVPPADGDGLAKAQRWRDYKQAHREAFVAAETWWHGEIARQLREARA